MKIKIQRPCWLVGHDNEFNDSGYPVCSCGSHSYWDTQNGWIWKWGGALGYIANKPKHLWYLYVGRHFSICTQCGWFYIAFGKFVGKHKNCLPF